MQRWRSARLCEVVAVNRGKIVRGGFDRVRVAVEICGFAEDLWVAVSYG